MNCIICNDPIVPAERFEELGIDYCMEPKCIHLAGGNIMDVTVVMAHKQGFNVIKASTAKGQNFMATKGQTTV